MKSLFCAVLVLLLASCEKKPAYCIDYQLGAGPQPVLIGVNVTLGTRVAPTKDTLLEAILAGRDLSPLTLVKATKMSLAVDSLWRKHDLAAALGMIENLLNTPDTLYFDTTESWGGGQVTRQLAHAEFFSIKHYAAFSGVQIALQRGDAPRAEAMLELAKQYPVHSDCGNANEEDRYTIEKLSASIFEAKGEYDSAIKLFAYHFDHPSFAPFLARNILKRYSKREIRLELNRAIESIQLDTTEYGSFLPNVTLFGNKLPLYLNHTLTRSTKYPLTKQEYLKYAKEEFVNSWLYAWLECNPDFPRPFWHWPRFN